MTRLDRWEQRTGPWLTGLALLSFVTLVLDGLMESGSGATRWTWRPWRCRHFGCYG
jgi:hypothetical protein